MTASRNTRRWFQVSLKSLLLLTLVAAAYLAGLGTALRNASDELVWLRKEVTSLRKANVILKEERSVMLADADVIGRVRAADVTEGLVEINLGTDDGLKRGDKLNVYRDGPSYAKTRFLGRIQLTCTNKSVAVGRVLPSYGGTSAIQRDDHVVTRFSPFSIGLQ